MLARIVQTFKLLALLDLADPAGFEPATGVRIVDGTAGETRTHMDRGLSPRVYLFRHCRIVGGSEPLQMPACGIPSLETLTVSVVVQSEHPALTLLAIKE